MLQTCLRFQIQHLLKLNSSTKKGYNKTNGFQIQHLLKLNVPFAEAFAALLQFQIQHLLKLNVGVNTYT